MKFASVLALLLATSPVAAQTTTSTSTTSTGSSSSTTSADTTCNELMTGTFCNEPAGPNATGYGSNGGAAATGTGITTPSPAIPACGEGVVTANELCN
jgi:hypothetical protein